MAKFIAGTEDDRLSLKLCAALGIDPTLVRRVIVDLQAGDAARVYFETFADDQVLDVAFSGDLVLVTSKDDV